MCPWDVQSWANHNQPVTPPAEPCCGCCPCDLFPNAIDHKKIFFEEYYSWVSSEFDIKIWWMADLPPGEKKADINPDIINPDIAKALSVHKASFALNFTSLVNLYATSESPSNNKEQYYLNSACLLWSLLAIGYLTFSPEPNIRLVALFSPF